MTETTTETTTETIVRASLLALTLRDAPYFEVDCVTDVEIEDCDVLLFTATGPTMTALCQWSRDEGVIVIEWRDESATERILAETHTLADLASVGITNTTDSLAAFRSRTNSARCRAACVGISAVNNSASAIEACDVINSHGAVKYTHATDIGPTCHNCDSVHGEGLYAYRFIALSAWEARCVECHNTERFATHFSGNHKGLGPDANAAQIRMAHYVNQDGPCETLHYR